MGADQTFRVTLDRPSVDGVDAPRLTASQWANVMIVEAITEGEDIHFGRYPHRRCPGKARFSGTRRARRRVGCVSQEAFPGPSYSKTTCTNGGIHTCANRLMNSISGRAALFCRLNGRHDSARARHARAQRTQEPPDEQQCYQKQPRIPDCGHQIGKERAAATHTR